MSSLEAKLTSDIANAIKKLSPLEKITRLAAHDALRRTAKQTQRRGAQLAVQTRYAPKLGIRDAEASSKIWEKGTKTGLYYAAEDQEITIRFQGRALPIMLFNPREYPAGNHPIWGQLWATDITMFGRRVKTGAFHLKGNARKGADFKGSQGREDLHRNGLGGHPTTFDRNSKLFYRKLKSGKSLPITRFKTHSIGSLMASDQFGIEDKLYDFAMRSLDINIDSAIVRRMNAALRGR